MHLQKYEQKLGELYDAEKALGCGRRATEHCSKGIETTFNKIVEKNFPNLEKRHPPQHS